MDLILKDGVLDFLAEKGYNIKYGARNLQRFIQDNLVIPLSKKLNENDYDDQLVVEVSVKKDRLDMQVTADPLGLELLFEELDKINYTDYSSDLRRQLIQLKEGRYFIKLLSELDILERDKRKLKESFWTNKQRSTNYAAKLQFQERISELAEEIEDLESKLSMACLDIGKYNPGVIDQLKDWESRLFQFKNRLVGPCKSQFQSMLFFYLRYRIAQIYQVLFTDL